MNNRVTSPLLQDRPWFPALDGIRGIAILLILLCHFFDFIPFAVYGRTGVDLFFVLSGYLITDILLRTREHPHHLRNYFARRVLRIFPLYYVSVILFFLSARYVPVLQDQLHYYQQHGSYVWLHLQNWLYLLHEKPVNPAPLMNHFWSLSLEEQFYLLWPVIIYLFRKPEQLTRLLLFFLTVSIGLRMVAWFHWGDGYRYFYFQSVARLDGFAVGGLIAVWRFSGAETRRNLWRLILTLAVFELLLLFAGTWWVPGLPHSIIAGISLLTAGFGLLTEAGLSGRYPWLQRWLSTAWLRWCGKYSYGIYVYHWPVLILSRIYLLPQLQRWPLPVFLTAVVHAVLITLLTLLISRISYALLEKRFLALKSRF